MYQPRERGKPMEDKQYTYEIAPHYVSIFTDLGIDIVTLANNHALDYGTDASDTLLGTHFSPLPNAHKQPAHHKAPYLSQSLLSELSDHKW